MDINRSYKDVYDNYKFWLEKAKRQGYFSRTNFAFENMKDKIGKILEDNISIPEQVSLNLPKLPKLKKVDKKTELPKLKLPKLNKI